MANTDMTCPFCGEGDFDAIGLKRHLTISGWCEPFESVPFNDQLPDPPDGKF